MSARIGSLNPSTGIRFAARLTDRQIVPKHGFIDILLILYGVDDVPTVVDPGVISFGSVFLCHVPEPLSSSHVMECHS
jgi:hypothetical protein